MSIIGNKKALKILCKLKYKKIHLLAHVLYVNYFVKSNLYDNERSKAIIFEKRVLIGASQQKMSFVQHFAIFTGKLSFVYQVGYIEIS